MIVDRISKVVAVAALLAIPAWGEDDILVNKPDFVVFRPKMPISWQRRNPDLPRTPQEMRMTGDCYNDHFQVLEDAKRRMLFAFWTQASYRRICGTVPRESAGLSPGKPLRICGTVPREAPEGLRGRLNNRRQTKLRFDTIV